MSGGNTEIHGLEADYVIVGSGSAGSALAYRLAEDGRNSVLVIEYGGSDAGPFIQMPAALAFPMNMALYDWGYGSEPEPHLNGRRLVCPRGKVIGGSSSINGMVYVRGHAGDFDAWEEMGAAGWGYADVAPYFKRMETVHPIRGGGEEGVRGTNGPLHVTESAGDNPLAAAFIEAGRQAGFETTADYNGTKQEGFAPMQRTIWKGRRWSTASAYLKPAIRKGGVRVVRGLAERIVMDCRRATGVAVSRGGRREVISARKEVILAASSINSPKLLMLSGIGPAAHLKEMGIEVVADRPGVGANLQDHLELYIQMECLKPVTLNNRMNLFSKARIGAQWLLLKNGEGATNHFESVAFVRSSPGVQYPDIQFHFLPAAVRYDGTKAFKSHGFQAHVGPMRSKSRGRVRLTNSNPKADPSILFNYMSHPDDWTEFRQCIRLVREIFAQPAMAEFAGAEIAPGADKQSDDELDEFIREHAESAFHPCGTARMGRADDPLAVVDPDCRVIGVEGLRLADSSILSLIHI